MITMTTLMEKLPNREVTIEKKDCLLEKIDSFLFEIEPEIAERIKNYDSSITLDHIKKNINDSFLYDINLGSLSFFINNIFDFKVITGLNSVASPSQGRIP